MSGVSIKAIVYIDSRNIIHSLESHSIDVMKFDFKKLSEHVASNGGEFKKQVTIKMYGARYPSQKDLQKHNRDDAFYKHIENVLGIRVCYGKFKANGNTVVEKGVDVLLATHLIMDAVYNNYDHAFVFSSDTDLIPAIEEVRKFLTGTKIYICLNYDMRHLREEFVKAGAIPIMLSKALLGKFTDGKSVMPTDASLNGLFSKWPKGKN